MNNEFQIKGAVMYAGSYLVHGS